jgi:competence protein ComEA
VRLLTVLPGIGRETALKIVEYRIENGEYKSIEELINVYGIGPKKLEKIRKYVTIE